MSKEMSEYQQGVINAFASDPRFRSFEELQAWAQGLEAANERAREIREEKMRKLNGKHNIPYKKARQPRYNQPRPRDLIWQRRKNESRSNGSSPMTSNLVEEKPPTPQDPVQQIENAITSTETALTSLTNGKHPLEEIRKLATHIVLSLSALNPQTYFKLTDQRLQDNDS